MQMVRCCEWLRRRRRKENVWAVNHVDLTSHTPSLPARIHRLLWKSAWMPAAVELPNKELTPQMERRGDGGVCVGGGGEEEKGVAGSRDATVVSSGLWNQELSGALLRPCTATTTGPTPLPSAPLWSTGFHPPSLLLFCNKCKS